ncbi:hypothetical protein DID88_006546 [Monilinia fructigena]|uniref:Uncharacterized protein n=1 Tax=Monilinia fructigena TaxID=38457 RepID=A0A395IGV6_9HELO|nr:hypothetical protein DID88_006546 [Monilinia fructigena]
MFTMSSNIRDLTSDAFEALKLVARSSWRRNLKAWVQVPFGIVLILLACFGINALIGLSSVSFPASVACLILLTRALVSVIDIPTGWALRFINLFFTPSFVLLPLSDYITATEVGKIIGVFLVGFLVCSPSHHGYPIQELEPAVISNSSDQRGSPETESLPPDSPVAIQQEPLLLTRAQAWAAFINRNLDVLTYSVIFIFIGIPSYYATGYAMPFRRNLGAYKTGTKYVAYWDGKKNLPLPGAGDIFSSVLDASIRRNLNATAALAVMSGIFGVLIGQRLLALLRIRPEDYITIGVTMGGMLAQ